MSQNMAVVCKHQESGLFSRNQLPSIPPLPIPDLGSLEVTRKVVAEVGMEKVSALLCRHQQGDWGNVTPVDCEANAKALKAGRGRIISSYQCGDANLYVVTYWNRTKTLVSFFSYMERD